MDLPADAAAIWVVTGRRQHDPHRLTAGSAGCAGHDIPELAGRLGMQLIKNHAARLVAVLAVCLGGKHLHHADGDPLISAVTSLDPAAVLDALAALGDLQLAACDHFCCPRRARRHEDRRIVDDRGVFLVRRADIDLGVQFAVGKQVIEPQRGRKLAFAIFLGDLKIEIPVFSQPVRINRGREVLGV